MIVVTTGARKRRVAVVEAGALERMTAGARKRMVVEDAREQMAGMMTGTLERMTEMTTGACLVAAVEGFPERRVPP